MSDLLRQQLAHGRAIDQLAVIERPAARMAYAQNALNPVAVAGTVGAFGQFTAIVPLVWRVSVYVATTNNGSNYWTLSLTNSAGTTLATLSTAAIAANTWKRLSTTTITAPASSNVVIVLNATKTAGAPGAISILPQLLVAQ